MMNQTLKQQILERADHAARQTRLVVDYYRIRRKLAVPLPVRQIHEHAYPMRFDFGTYPWSIWLSLALEERIHCLGWGHTITGDQTMRSRLERDLGAWSKWPRLDQLDKPDLSLGHSLRMFVNACQNWPWLDADLQSWLREACQRGVNEHLDWFDAENPGVRNGEPISHNIPVIGTLSLAAAARFVDHAAADMLSRQASAMVMHIMSLREQGYSEGVMYDAYILYFMAHWLEGEDASQRDAVLLHPRFQPWLDQTVLTGAPGRAEMIAPLGDVEPAQFPFHIAAVAAFERLRPSPTGRWLLEHCDLNAFRSDVLGLLLHLPETVPAPPPSGAIDAHVAVALRSGYGPDDLAVVAGAGRSHKDHVHLDAGSVAIAHQGCWVIDDPGYQQYLSTSERSYTVGAQAHNTPLIDGQGQSQRACAQWLHIGDDPQTNSHYAAVDITEAYVHPKLKRGIRHLWLADNKAVVIADDLELREPATLSWNWHGHPEAAWWVEAGIASLYVNDVAYQLQCPQIKLGEAMVDRLRGSRGQLTLTAQQHARPGRSVTWWLLSVGEQADPQFGDLRCDWLGRSFWPHPQPSRLDRTSQGASR